jgi:uncharacterized protein (DUF362 family)
MTTHNHMISRRGLLGTAAASVGVGRARGSAPAGTVAVERCRTYEPQELVTCMERAFDAIDVGRIVRGKTVAIKVNMTGTPDQRLGHSPIGENIWTHPDVVCTAMHLMEKAGAHRFRILESPWKSSDPIEEIMLAAGWDPTDFTSAAKRVEFENTNYLGYGKKYHRFNVPGGGLLFPAFDLNHSYHDCDVLASIAKLKEHSSTGITLAMKNCFGITPCTIYGDNAGEKEPLKEPIGGRGDIIHRGRRQPTSCSPPEVDPTSPREDGYRVPRCVVDLVSARPVDLSIIDGVFSQAYSMGRAGLPLRPGLLVAGDNPVSTDAVGAALMGFDPRVDRGDIPFEQCDNMLRMAEDVGVGSRDLARIEVAGLAIGEGKVDYREVWKRHGLPERRRLRRY